jgi:hypothetical protein
MRNLTGKLFGKLIVTKYLHPSNTNRGTHYWECKCACGTIKSMRDSHLIAGTIKSCGCLQKRRGKDSPSFKGTGEIPLNYYTGLKRAAKGGGILNRKEKYFNVSIDYLWNLYLKQNRKCALSGMDIGFDGTTLENKCKETSKFTCSLDRIDSSQGYTEGNVQWVHKNINLMKNSFSTDTFISFCKKVAELN